MDLLLQPARQVKGNTNNVIVSTNKTQTHFARVVRVIHGILFQARGLCMDGKLAEQVCHTGVVYSSVLTGQLGR